MKIGKRSPGWSEGTLAWLGVLVLVLVLGLAISGEDWNLAFLDQFFRHRRRLCLGLPQSEVGDHQPGLRHHHAQTR